MSAAQPTTDPATSDDVAPPLSGASVDERSRFSRRAWSLAAIGLLVRLVAGRFEPPPPTRLGHGPLAADETWYVQVARNVLHGRGFVTNGPGGVGGHVLYPSALHGPLTVLLLLPATWIQPHGYSAQRATVGVLGALSILVLAYTGRELGGVRLGLVAGGIAALYPGLWVNDLVATSESPAILLLSTVALLTLRIRRGATPWKLAALGLVLGLLALDRAELAVLGLALAVPTVVVASRGLPRRRRAILAGLIVVVAVPLAVVAPWSVYNQVRFHQTVLVSDDLGRTLLGANCSQGYFGPLTGYDGTACFLPVAYAESLAHPHFAEPVADAYFLHAAVTFATGHASRWPVVGVLREAWLWSLWRPAWTVHMASAYLGRPTWLSWLQIASFLALAPMALVGAVLARRRRLVLWPFIAMVGYTALVGLLVVGHLRYRIAAEVAAVLLAAVAVERLLGPRAATGARDA